MKTKEELHKEFQQKFDVRRKKNFIKMCWIVPIMLFVAIGLLIYGSIELSLVLHGDHCKDTSVTAFVSLLIGVCIIAFVVLYIVIALGEYALANSASAAKGVLNHKQQKAEKIISALTLANALLDTIIVMIPYTANFHDPTEIKKNLNILKAEKAKRVEDLQKQLDPINEDIEELKVELEIYLETRERTFKQYWKSKKWTKRNQLVQK